METLKFRIHLYTRVFVTLCRYTTLLTKQAEKWKYGNLIKAKRKIICFVLECQAFPLMQENTSLFTVANRCIYHS
jgi:hypothetical protein